MGGDGICVTRKDEERSLGKTVYTEDQSVLSMFNTFPEFKRKK